MTTDLAINRADEEPTAISTPEVSKISTTTAIFNVDVGEIMEDCVDSAVITSRQGEESESADAVFTRLGL